MTELLTEQPGLSLEVLQSLSFLEAPAHGRRERSFDETRCTQRTAPA